jgi:cathepsin B
MIKAVFVIALAAFATAMPMQTEDDGFVVDRELIENINHNMSTYWAGVNERFIGWTWHDAKKLMGTLLDKETFNLPVKSHAHIADSDVPASFDARQQWPKYIHPIRDQQQCGSCWAFAASEVLSDRFAIASQGSDDAVLSPEDLVSCDGTDMGCQGGMLSNAWNYLANTGIVTDKCFPYTAGQGTPATCETSCVDGESFKKYKSKDAYQLKTVADIKKDIMTNGPVEAGFTVYKSFMAYKSGVYQHHWWALWDQVLGGHAVKIVGWGSENGVDYWLVANSWSTAWGEDGFFKIKQGNCGIESQVFAGHPAL